MQVEVRWGGQMTKYLSVPENSTGRTVGLRDACGFCGPAASPGASEDGILDPQNLEGLWLGSLHTLLVLIIGMVGMAYQCDEKGDLLCKVKALGGKLLP